MGMSCHPQSLCGEVNLDQLRVSDGRQLDSGWRGSVDICAFGGEGVQQKEMNQQIYARELKLTI